ncbi:hypothetical protein HMPREF0591_6347 [Mycobacterium parascrofulaceum ATCC BAA-614]|uniref:Uncharacterized protein n=1 Tax=Mycobacterium parascrofulaceum ATCC BAA-614 TaxID=525368 RepID=D5PJK3_9MYCO|nr:hypothetical protein HMPREF0591_6347 [Mycobacterium parascrofulaceum ATCC BAA-614]
MTDGAGEHGRPTTAGWRGRDGPARRPPASPSCGSAGRWRRPGQ